MNLKRSRPFFIFGMIVVFFVAIFLRAGGLFRGLDGQQTYIFHPDAPKQVRAVQNYLDGRFVWYTGSWFYDGYPYGLNLVDAVILKPIHGVVNAARSLVKTEAGQTEPTWSLFHQVRLLRVLYGLITITLIMFVCRKLGTNLLLSLLGGLWVAVAPISVAVTHSGSGDIGVDLFTTAMMCALALHVYKKKGYCMVYLAAFFSGMAFACKYHGLLTLFCVGWVIAFEHWLRREVKKMVTRGGVALFFSIIGVLVLKPDLLLDTSVSWKHMINNFYKIQAFNVPETFRELPLMQKMMTSWKNNFFRIGDALNFPLLGLSFVLAMGYSTLLIRASLNKGQIDESDFKKYAFISAVAWCPFLVLLSALSGKPKLHPFHFSFLVPLLTVAVTVGVGHLSKTSILKNGLFLLLSGVVLSNVIQDARSEHFYWTREDNMRLSLSYADTVLTYNPQGQRHTIKSLELEPQSVSVFRNRNTKAGQRATGLRYWMEKERLPLPTIPYPDPSSWIFGNGPTFLRNDRMFHIPKYTRVRKDLVLTAPVEELTLGIRSGMKPTAVNLFQPQAETLPLLPPQQWQIIKIPAGKAKQSKTRKDGAPLWIYPLELNAGVGDAWISVLQTPLDEALFRLYSGDTNIHDLTWFDAFDCAAVTESASAAKFISLLPRASEKQVTYTLQLPAGIYTLRCLVRSDTPHEIMVRIQDTGIGKTYSLQNPDAIPVEAGETWITHTFTKSYQPYEFQLRLQSEKNSSLEVLEGYIEPDTRALCQALTRFVKNNEALPWDIPTPPDLSQTMESLKVDKVVFNSLVELKNIAKPHQIIHGEPIRLEAEAYLLDRDLKWIEENQFFLHLYQGKEQIFVGNLSLIDAIQESSLKRTLTFDPPLEVPAGEYRLYLGCWNIRTQNRFKPEADHKKHISDDRFYLGDISVIESQN